MPAINQLSIDQIGDRGREISSRYWNQTTSGNSLPSMFSLVITRSPLSNWTRSTSSKLAAQTPRFISIGLVMITRFAPLDSR